jgi:hypothetical protein
MIFIEELILPCKAFSPHVPDSHEVPTCYRLSDSYEVIK